MPLNIRAAKSQTERSSASTYGSGCTAISTCSPCTPRSPDSALASGQTSRTAPSSSKGSTCRSTSSRSQPSRTNALLSISRRKASRPTRRGWISCSALWRRSVSITACSHSLIRLQESLTTFARITLAARSSLTSSPDCQNASEMGKWTYFAELTGLSFTTTFSTRSTSSVLTSG